ncbi:MAG: ATP-binding cassette domain-containing protein [Rhodothermaceae bacterium]|nr:ATP-binding cassette domain-containing protein [Rhodothermaceae bacterium]
MQDRNKTEEKKRPPLKLIEALRRIFGFTKPFRGRLITALVLSLLTASVWLVLPLGLRTMVDAVFEDANRGLLDRLTLLLLGLFIVQAAIGFAGYYLLEWTGERLVTDLRKKLYAHLHELDLRFFSSQRTGDLTSRLTNDVGTVRTAVTTSFVELIRQVMMLLGSMALMVVLDWQMSMIILLTVPPVTLLARYFGQLIRKLAREVQDRLADTTAIAEEAISSIRVVKSFSREEYERERYDDAVQELFKTAIRRLWVSNLFWTSVGTLFMMALIGLFWFGGVSVLNGRLTSGDLVAFVFYAFNIARNVGGLSQLYTTFNSAAGASERLFELFDTESDTSDKEGAQPIPRIEGAIEFDDVSFSYEADNTILYDISTIIRPGETVALVGPSGAGKTTLLNLIPRFYDPYSGVVRIDGQDISGVTMQSLRDQIAVVSQDVQLFNMTVQENITYGRLDASREDVEEAARAANAHTFILELMEGYDSVVGERGTKLSGGQKQRIAIARAILRDARILLLDEATSSLDSTSEALVQEALDRLMDQRTTIVIAHRLSTVQHADRILVIDKGRIVQEGRHEDLFAREGLYRELALHQFNESGVAV